MSTKETVLKLLQQHQDYLSGSEIAHQLDISRAAVWKAIKKLEEEGYTIHAVTNKGYLLKEDKDVLSKEVIESMLQVDINLEVENIVTSTNTLLVQRAIAGEKEGLILVAGMQTNGKGRTGHTFYSPKQSGIYLSVLLRPTHLTPYEATNITSMAAVSACEAMEAMGKHPGIKWVNDVFIDHKKVCGILTEGAINMETRSMDYVVMGIGLNAYVPEGGFPEDIKDIAGSILDERIENGRNKIIAAFINSFMTYYHHYDKKEYFEAYRKRSLVLGKEVEVDTPEGRKKVFAKDVDDNFELIIIDQGVEKTVSSGEVHIKL